MTREGESQMPAQFAQENRQVTTCDKRTVGKRRNVSKHNYMNTPVSLRPS
jgi:hypothetical protein